MTATEVLLNFREALVALLPMAERVGIAWQRHSAYDQWDSIATHLYRRLVVEPLGRTGDPLDSEEFSLPPYDLLLRDYSGLSTVEVNHPELPSGRWIFHAFASDRSPFDVAELLEISYKGKVVTGDLRTIRYDRARFTLRVSNRVRDSDAIEALGAPSVHSTET